MGDGPRRTRYDRAILEPTTRHVVATEVLQEEINERELQIRALSNEVADLKAALRQITDNRRL